MTERVARHETALRASGHSHPETYTYVDSATNVDMSSSRENAVRVEEIPVQDRCPVDGVGGQVVQTHYVFKSVPPAIRRPGKPHEYRTVWSEHNRHDIVATDTLAELGLDVFTASAEGGQMYLSPSGLDPRDERTRIRCVRVNGLQAVPGGEAGTRGATALGARSGGVSTRRPPGLTAPAAASKPPAGRAPAVAAATAPADPEQHAEVEPRSDDEAGRATPTVSEVTFEDGEPEPCDEMDWRAKANRIEMQLGDLSEADRLQIRACRRHANDIERERMSRARDAGDRQAGEAGERDDNAVVDFDLGPATDRVPRQQRRPISYVEFRQRLGNASHDETMHAAKRMGVRLTGSDAHRGRLDRQRATANQIATAARKVADPGIFPRARLTVITDTVGPMPVSALGNRYMQSWVIKGQPGYIVVTCSPDKSAASSWAGFEVFARERGIELQRDAIHQSIELVHDCGTEYLGEFLTQCQRAGFVQRSATPHKDRKFEAHPSEGANRQLEAQMRINVVASRRLFEAEGLDARRYWDRAVKYGARQVAVRTHCRRHNVAYDQMKRELLAPGFGAPGTVKIQGGDTKHRQPGGKQLADRSVPGLFVGVTPNHKCIMVLRDGRIMITSDVGFPVAEPETPLNASADTTPDDEWMAPVDDVFQALHPTREAASGNVVTPSTKPDTQSGGSVPAVPSQVPGQDTPSAKPDAQSGVLHQVPSQNDPAVPSKGVLNPKLSEAESEAEFLTGSKSTILKLPANQKPAPGEPDAPPPAEDAVLPDAGATPVPEAEPTFTDQEGKTVSLGDHIAVTTNGEEQYGVVTDIDNTDHRTPGGEVRVDFADGTDDYEYYPLQHRRRAPMRKRFDAATHRALIGTWSRPVCLRLTAAPPPRAPHPSVLPYLDTRGNILPQYLDGSATLPPAPPLPGPEARIITPVNTADALAQPEAFFWLHSHVRELRGHLAPTNRPPTSTTPRSARGGAGYTSSSSTR